MKLEEKHSEEVITQVVDKVIEIKINGNDYFTNFAFGAFHLKPANKNLIYSFAILINVVYK